ncbi:hypothetical protein KZX45_15110 [Georgenia sp. EYE_87]|uniref:hypothetical protein n=1 Tax=Georgenia sp. EYE_87 TaxID=2853448 RepID=UPI00200569A7|nr:hypothetical protein [Georgenia sp. EYE_87]MCK6211876.1 hypothetical protein [Georgenia sp. EYE_87]
MTTAGPNPPPPQHPGTPWPGSAGPPPAARYGPEAYQGRPARPSAWSGARIAAVLVGILLALFGLGAFGTGLALGFFHVVARDDGYVTSPGEHVTSEGYAVLLGDAEVNTVGMPVDWPQRIVGDVRVRAESLDGGEIFVGIAPAFEAHRYLDGVHHHEVGDSPRWSVEHDGGEPAGPPEGEDFWREEAAGPGVQTLEVDELTTGRWALVVMSPDAEPGIDARVDVGATLPWLPWATVAALVIGLLALAGAVALIVSAARGARGGPPGAAPHGPVPYGAPAAPPGGPARPNL